ncbi:sodium/hydrogen exchanger 9B2-like [Parasteatoda tepidariorum]|uniref:sodium/hydrogen exchanger 9B2-like n=1 Tax=Parasteatoda tepidariorum TaxID=114398 RepID=UPI0039BC573E
MEVSLIQSSAHILPPRVHTTVEVQMKKKWWQVITAYILPNRRQINRYITQMFCVLFLYAISYGMLGDDALPGSAIFALFVIVIAAFLGGKCIGLLKMPPLVGMLIVGFLFRNIREIPFYHHIPKKVTTDLREIALSIILLRAGISLDGKALKKLKLAVLRLAICPQFTEVLSLGILGHFLLGLPFIFSFMLGFIISNISPEIVLPPLLEYERQGYGVKKGIPALVIGATSLDDVVAITGFTVCFSVAVSTKDLFCSIIKAILEPIIGLALAVIFGILFWYFPKTYNKRKIKVYYNVLMVVLGSIGVMFLSQRVKFAGSGPLACITLGFIACIEWRKDPQQFEGVYNSTLLLWEIVEPLLFSLIGAEITVEILHSNAGWTILSLILSLFFRTIMTYFATFGCNLNYKEKLFICCSYLPKASVQAAIGSLALDYARGHDYSEEFVQFGLIVLNVCVLSLLLTAPLAAILIHFMGPILLTKDRESLHRFAFESSELSREEEEIIDKKKEEIDKKEDVNGKKVEKSKDEKEEKIVGKEKEEIKEENEESSFSLLQEISEREKRISKLIE